MDSAQDYLAINKAAWNKQTEVHLTSDFYDNPSFLKGRSSLNTIELDLLGDVRGKRILHLQCHFGQDSISLARMGASVVGVDLSDKAIDEARKMAKDLHADAEFICCDVYNLPNHLKETFDLVFTSYGTIGWLPDMNRWAAVVAHFMKPAGKFVFVEFHPVVWMYDDVFKEVAYSYFNVVPIVESQSGTYADTAADIKIDHVSWNHPISEVLNALIQAGITIKSLDEFNYSPYNCFKETEEFQPGKFRIKHLGDKLPMVYSILGTK